MRIGFRKILRDLRRSKGRTLLAVLSIAIGVFAVGMASGMNELLPERMISSYRETNPAHIYTYLNGIVSDDDVNRLARLPGLAGVEGQRGLGARWRLAADAPWRDATVTMRGDYNHQKFNTTKLISGEWPTKDSIAVERSTVDFFHVPTSGTISMLIDNREHELKVVGVVEDINIRAPAFGGNATFFVSKDMAEAVFGARGYTRLGAQVPSFTTPSANACVDTLKPQLEKIGAPMYLSRVIDPNTHPAQDTVNGITMILGVMAVLSLALGLFLVINTVSAIVAQQVPQIGMMKAIGGTTRQMLLLYLSSVVIYSLLALLIALPLGALAARGLTNSLLPLMAIQPDPAFRVSQSAITQQIMIGLLVRILSRLRGLPRPAALTLRNTFRRKGRVVLTEITLILAGVVFVMVQSSAESFTYSIHALTESLGLKVLINFQQPLRSEEVSAVIAAQPNIDKIEMQLFQTGSAFRDKDAEKGEDIFINAMRPASALLKLPVVAGRWLLPDDEHAVVLNRDRADKLGVTIGDKVWISLAGSTAKTEWTVVGTVFDLNDLQRDVFVPLPVYQREVGLVGRTTAAWVSTRPDDGATQQRVESQLRDTLNARGLRVGSTLTQETIRTQNENNFGIITKMLLAMAALIAAVGAIGLAGTLSINVLERRREIGVMRAIGSSSLTIAGIFVGEGLLLGLIAWVIAIPLSVPVGQVFATVIGQVIQFSIIYQFSWNGALQWLIIIIVLSILGSAVPAMRATRLSVRESLAYE